MTRWIAVQNWNSYFAFGKKTWSIRWEEHVVPPTIAWKRKRNEKNSTIYFSIESISRAPYFQHMNAKLQSVRAWTVMNFATSLKTNSNESAHSLKPIVATLIAILYYLNIKFLSVELVYNPLFSLNRWCAIEKFLVDFIAKFRNFCIMCFRYSVWNTRCGHCKCLKLMNALNVAYGTITSQ